MSDETEKLGSWFDLGMVSLVRNKNGTLCLIEYCFGNKIVLAEIKMDGSVELKDGNQIS